MAAVCIALVTCCCSSVAQANVTESRIISPSSPVYAFNDTGASGAISTFTVQGTYVGSARERLAINCYAADGTHQTVAEAVEGVAGSFSAPVSPSVLLAGPPCVLRAVGNEDYASYPPGSEGPFRGPTLATSELYESSIYESRFDYDLTSVAAGSSYELASADDCGLGHSSLYSDPSLTSSAGAFVCDAALLAQESIEGQEPARSEIRIDGVDAYGPYSAERLFGPLAGIPSLSVSKSFDPATGSVTIHEVDPLVHCAPAPLTFPPTATSCSAFVSAGVSLVRSWRTEDSGRSVELTDAWSSTDGAAHTFDALYDESLASDGPKASGLLLPGDSTFADRPSGTASLLPSGPGSIYYVGAANTPAGGDGNHPFVAINYDSAPDGPLTLTHSDEGGGSETSFVLPYRREIPPGGASTLRMDFVQAYALAEVRSLATEAVNGFSPFLSIVSPSDGAQISTEEVLLLGEARSEDGPATLTVDGKAVAVTPNGSWSQVATLAPGINSIPVVATGSGGLRTARNLNITYEPPPGEPPSPETDSPNEAPVAPPSGATDPTEEPPLSALQGASESSAGSLSLISTPFALPAPERTEPTTASPPLGDEARSRASVIGVAKLANNRVIFRVACHSASGPSCEIGSLLTGTAAGPRERRMRGGAARRGHPRTVTFASSRALVEVGRSASISIRTNFGVVRSLSAATHPQLKLVITLMAGRSATPIAVQHLTLAGPSRRAALRRRTKRAAPIQ